MRLYVDTAFFSSTEISQRVFKGKSKQKCT